MTISSEYITLFPLVAGNIQPYLGVQKSLQRKRVWPALWRVASVATLALLAMRNMASQAPPTIAQTLRKAGIGLDEASLVVALRDPRPGVRGGASAELAELKLGTAVPATLVAAAAEKQELVQAEMYESAAELGSAEAMKRLAVICRHPASSGDARLVAARILFSERDHVCFSAVADMMLPSEKPEDRIGAWYLLAQLHDRTDQETRLILKRLLPALSDNDPHLRLEASTVLRFLNDPSATKPLQAAIAAESETAVEEQMKGDLASLSTAQK